MKIQLTLLLVVVLLASLPSVVFAQPPLSAVQSGETSQPAKATDIVQKSWKGSFYGLGLGAGLGRLTAEEFGGDRGSLDLGFLHVQVRLGYGISDRTVLFGAVSSLRTFQDDDDEGGWATPIGSLGVMFRRKWDREFYGFLALGASRETDGVRAFHFSGGYGMEIHPQVSLELTGAIDYVPLDGGSVIFYRPSITLNYHWY